jgi:hypothetical protein
MAERVPLERGKKLICPVCRMPHLKADLREAEREKREATTMEEL